MEGLNLALSPPTHPAVGWRPERDMTQPTTERIVAPAFWALAVICLLNLNDLGRMWTGVPFPLSVPMLVCCLLTLPALLRIQVTDALGGMGALLLAALASYLCIGIAVVIATPEAVRTDAWDYLDRYLRSILLIVAATVGGDIVLRRAGRERTLLGVLVLLTASCVFMLASPLLMSVFRNPPVDGDFRYFGTFANPNEAGFVASLAVVLAIAFIRAGRFTVVGYGGLFVAASASIGTYSRTAIAILAFLLAQGALKARGRERWRFLAALVVVGWLFTRTLANLDAGLLAGPQVERLYSLFDMVESRSTNDVSMGGRLTLWQIALERTLDSPLVGSGLGRLHSLEEAPLSDEGIPLGAHNMYLMLWGEAGFIPVTLFVLFLAGLLRFGMSGRQGDLTAAAVGGWGLVLLLSGLTSHSVLLSRPGNFVMGLTLAATAVIRSPRAPPPAPIHARREAQ